MCVPSGSFLPGGDVCTARLFFFVFSVAVLGELRALVTRLVPPFFRVIAMRVAPGLKGKSFKARRFVFFFS